MGKKLSIVSLGNELTSATHDGASYAPMTDDKSRGGKEEPQTRSIS